MADHVQEQMGDILSAYGIPELAKDIYAITGEDLTGDVEEKVEEATQAADEMSTKEGQGDGRDDKDDIPMDDVDDSDESKDENNDDNGHVKEESSSNQDCVKENEEMLIDSEDSNQSTNLNSSGLNDFKLQQTKEEITGEQRAVKTTDQPTVQNQNSQELGLMQSMASGNGSRDASHSSLGKNLLMSSVSKTVMTPVPQGQLPQSQGQSQGEETPLGDDQLLETSEQPLSPLTVPLELTSITEFNSFFERCKEEIDILARKKAILGKSRCIVSYKCPKLTDEQAAALQMTKETFKCPGCEDMFLFKTSLETHLERKTVLIQFSCRWCKGRQNLVFTNRCGFHAHLKRHGAKAEEIEEVKMRTFVTPATAVDSFRIYNSITAPEQNIPLKVSPPVSQKTSAVKTQVTAPETSSLPSVPISKEGNASPVGLNGEKLQVSASYVVDPSKQTVTVTSPQVFSQAWNGFKCFGCRKNLGSRENLKSHLKAISMKSSLLQCIICKMVVGNPCKLAMHAAVHKNEGEFPCPECGTVYRDLQNLLIHDSIDCLHFLHKPLFKCQFCLKYATSFSGLIRHFEWNHVEVFFKCMLCQLAFRNNESATEHSIQVHRENRRQFGLLHKCPFCKSVYSERKLLESHFETHVKKGDIKIEKFVISCYMCSKPFDHQGALRNHMTTIHKKSATRNYKCDVCLLTFADVSYVMSHRIKCAARVKVNLPADSTQMQTTPSPSDKNQPEVSPRSPSGSQKIFVCGKCGMKFTDGNLQALRNHMVEKHAYNMSTETGKMDPAVPSAGTSSTDTDAKAVNPLAQVHRDSTLKVERFTKLQCGKCDYVSNDRIEFERHIETHQKDEHSQCHECGVSFRIKESLRKHLFLKHKIRDVDAFHKMCVELVEKVEEEERRKKQEEREKRRKEQEEQMDTNGPLDVKENTTSNADADKEEEEDPLKCKVCKAEFENEKLFTAHIRSHGLAYLKHQLSKSPEKVGRSPEKKVLSISNPVSKMMDTKAVPSSEAKPVPSTDASSNDSAEDTDSTDDSV